MLAQLSMHDVQLRDVPMGDVKLVFIFLDARVWFGKPSIYSTPSDPGAVSSGCNPYKNS